MILAKLSEDGKYVIVESGDTLSQIAADYGKGKTYQQLAAINKIPNANRITVEQRIYLDNIQENPQYEHALTAKTVTIKQWGLQSGIDNSLLVTWTWDRKYTKEYRVQWQYYADGTWFSESESTTKNKYSTYTIPQNAKIVRVSIKPVSTTYKSNDNDVSHWTADWSPYNKSTYNVPAAVPETPSVPSVSLDGLSLTAEVNNIDSSTTIIQFEVVKDNSTVAKNDKVSVKTGNASYRCSILAGSVYKVRCRAYRSGMYSKWSDYSTNINTIPSTPGQFVKCEPKTNTSIYLEWTAVGNATSYDIEYTTKQTNFDGSDQVSSKTGIKSTSYELTSGIESGQEYFFRIRAVNSEGTSGWSEISSTIIGTGPASPTTWSSTTTAIVGESLNLYWAHNSRDGSSQTYAELEIIVDGLKEIHTIQNSTNENEKDKTSIYQVNTASYVEGTQILWRVRTAGISKIYGDWSIQRVVDIYAPPAFDTFEIRNSSNVLIDGILSSLPIKVYAVPGPATQTPIGYHLSIISNEIYETVDNVGNIKIVNKGDSIYSQYFDTKQALSVTISAGNISIESNISYTMKCLVTMNSGLSAEASVDFVAELTDLTYMPTAEIGIDTESFSAYIRPYCAQFKSTIYEVIHSAGSYTKTTNTIDGVYGEIVEGVKTTTDEDVYSGVTSDGNTTYYCIVETVESITDVLLSVYRRESDGSFKEISSQIDGAKNITVTDPHPALDYARYRIVAISKTTGEVSYYDMPGQAVGGTSVILQWDEAWSNYDINGSEDALQQPAWSGSLLKLPYNIKISDKHSSDVELVEYSGRKHPVSYYGTHLGETSTWNVEIVKEDIDTLYALRRLAVWMGDVYVREPSGTGYWAQISISFSQSYSELTIPVTIEIARVEGGV